MLERAAELPLVREDDPARELRLERVEERLHVGVVAGPARARALYEAQAREVFAERRAQVLRARSLWKISARARRACTARVRTPQVTAAVRRRVSDQARTRREYWSITTAR